jgi:glycosyltransferase involved in cell wall biosynthesis
MNTSPTSAPRQTERPLRLAFLYMKGRAARRSEVERGMAPSEFFYGAIELARAGHEISHLELDAEAAEDLTGRVLGRILPSFARPVKMSPSIVVQTLRLARQLNRADCLVATGGNVAFALAALARAGIIRRPIVGIQCGILNFPHSRARRWLSRALLLKMHTLLFGEAELQPMRRFFDLPEEVISVNLFGVDTDFWRPHSGTLRDIVLAIGNDARRDYSTLLAAAERVSLPVHIVTKVPLPSVLPANVIHHHGSWQGEELSDAQIRALYQRASVTVVPLHPTSQPSGQSVTLQAMACGSPVVLTETEGLWSRQQLEDGRNVLLVRPGDSGQLAARIGELIEDPGLAERLALAGRAGVERNGSIGEFAAEIARWCNRLTSERGNIGVHRTGRFHS